MRTNLLALILLLALVAVLYENVQEPPLEKIEWEASFWLREPHGFGADWLDLQNDHYIVCMTGCTGAYVVDRGRVKRNGSDWELVSESGKRKNYTLKEEKTGRSLRDSAGKSYSERYAQVPRLHPERAWLRNRVPLELNGIRPGMGRPEILQMFPRARPDGPDALVDYPYPESEYERVTIELDPTARVRLIGGIRLSQAGRPLLNLCSTRRDVECLFGRLRWTSEDQDSFGYSETAHYGNLTIRVHSLVGMKHEEAQLTELVLTQ